MPTRGQYTHILIDGYELSGTSNMLDVMLAAAQLDVTPFQSAGRQYLPEPVEASIDQSGYFNGGAAGDFEKTVYDRLGTGSCYVTAMFGTDIVACVTYTLRATRAHGLNIQSPATGIVTIKAKWGGGSGIKRGNRTFVGVIASTGAQAHIDLGVAGTLGGNAYLHVTAITGSASGATITVQSANNTGFTGATTHGTFTFSAIGAAEMAITGTINRYIRQNVTSLGGATNFTVQGAIAVNGVTT